MRIIDESFLWMMRTELRTALAPRSFLKRDRGDCMYVSNAPIPAAIPGFIVEKQGTLIRILPDEKWILRLEKGCPKPPDSFCESLMRFCGAETDRDGLKLFAQGAKLLDAGSAATEAEISAYDRALRQRAALALRSACPGGGLYAAALINAQIHINNNIKGENNHED